MKRLEFPKMHNNEISRNHEYFLQMHTPKFLIFLTFLFADAPSQEGASKNNVDQN